MTKKRLYTLLGCLILVLIMGVVGVALLMNRNKPVMGEVGVKLYWNIDRDEYVGDSSAGMNSRERAEDGFYKVRFAVDGEQVEYNVEKARLVHEIDSMDIMGLAINDEGTITKVFDPEDITGGEVASMYYVVFGSDTTITVCPEEDLDGDYKMLNITEKTGVYNVTGMDPVGHVDNAVTSDRIRAFQNKEGEITHVFIVERYGYWAGESVEKYCEHCKESVEWYIWEQKYALPTNSGHWILKNNAKISAQHRITADKNIILDLNGKTVTGPDSRRVYAMTGENSLLAIMDSSAEGTGTIIGHGSPDNGGIVYVRYGTFELYGGILDASDIETLQFGSAVRINTECIFNMYGGEIIGGTVIGSMDEDEKKTTGGYGGTIQVSGTFNMYDGVIRDGKALRYKKKDGNYTCGNGGNIHLGTNAVFNMYGGEILKGIAESAGGNVYMSKNVVVNISGGTISGGSVVSKGKYGGNIYVNANSQLLNITGGAIKHGKAWGAGGNIALYAAMNMSGGTITGGSSLKGSTYAEAVRNEESPHHNVYCAGGTFDMSGGLIDGYVRIRDRATQECTVNLSGTAQIKGGSMNLTLDPGDDVNIGILKKGAAIYVDGGGYVSTKTAKTNTAYVHSSYEGVETQYINSKIFIGKQSCVCGHTDGQHVGDCDGTVLDWIPWGTKTSVPSVEANWYLVVDVQEDVQVKIPEKATFRLDLNGHTITGDENVRIYALKNGGINMIVTDLSSGKNGRIITKGDAHGRGSCIWVSDNSKLTIYGGTLDASKASGLYGGTTLTVSAGCKAVMYDGTIIGGQSLYLETEQNGKVKKSNGFGGSVAVYGTFEMYGGTITGGRSEGNGGNVYVTTDGKFVLAGGTISDGVTDSNAGKGGNLYVNGSLTMTGGTVEAGHARQGGNIFLKDATGEHIPSFIMKGGLIADGVAGAEGLGGTGGNVVILGAFTMTDGTIAGGKILGKEDQSNGNVYTKPGANGCTFTMTGGTITGLMKANNAGTLTIGGTARITNSNGDTNLTLADNATIEIKDIKEGALIGVSPQYDSYFASGAVSGDENYFTPDKQYKLIELVDEDKLIIVPDWEPWTETTSLPTESGMYYLTGDITLEAAAAIENSTIILDLKGYTIETSEEVKTIPRVYVLKEESTLSIYDSSEEGTGKIVSHRKYAAIAGVIEIREAGATFNLYGGTIDASDVELLEKVTNDKTTYHHGAAVYVNAGTTFNMYGGTIVGGTAYYGGSVYVAADTANGTNPGVLNISGGTIKDGNASQGGNIYLQADATNKTGAAQMNLTGGSITGGVASTGGNIAALGVFNMVDGQISGGTSTKNATGGNVYATPGSNGCAFTMSGGTVSGLVRVNAVGSVVLSGTAKITGGETNLTLTNKPATIVTNGLTEGAEISVNLEYATYYLTKDDKLYFGEIKVAEDIQYLKSDDGSNVVVMEENKLMLVTEWTADDSLPTGAGYYRLMTNVQLSAAHTMSEGNTIFIDLNGKNITAPNKKRALQVNSESTLYILDTSDNSVGKIIGNASTNEGGVVLVYGGSTVNFYSGSVDASSNECINEYGGGAVSVRTDSTFNMYGGNIIGGSATSDSCGGNVVVRAGGIFNMYDGEISGGKSGKYGGNMYVHADTSKGENPGVFNMMGGIITTGTGTQGGNVYLQADSENKTGAAELHMSGGVIKNGTATVTGGNVAALGVFEMTGGEIKDGICNVSGDHKYAANVYTLPGKNGASFTMFGGTIQGWVRVNAEGTLTLGGTAIITNGSGSCGLHFSKTAATIAIDPENPLVEGAEIYLSVNTMTVGNKLATGTIADTYQKYLKLCGSGSLEFKSGGIYVAE